MAKQMTKQQLIDENARLRAECDRLECALASAEGKLSASPLDAAYFDYVRRMRHEAHQRGDRVVKYMTAAQWDASRRTSRA